METRDKLAIMLAFDDGATIQSQPVSGIKKWRDVISEPTWNWELLNYRVKSAEPERRTLTEGTHEMHLSVNEFGRVTVSRNIYAMLEPDTVYRIQLDGSSIEARKAVNT